MPTGGSTRSVLDLLHRWLTAPAAESGLAAALGELRAAFGVSAAGLATPDGRVLAQAGRTSDNELPLSWAQDRSLLEKASHEAAVPVHRADGDWLLALVRHPGHADWLLWLHEPAAREWDSSEVAALALAGQVLTRWLASPDSHPRWSDQLDRAARLRRIEDIALLTRRLAHDYGNVLTGIFGFSELSLGLRLPSGSPVTRFLNEVYHGARNGVDLTRRLQLFARREAPSGQATTLAGVAAQEEARLRPQWGEAVRFQLDLPPTLPAVAIDPESLRHVLTALLDNAREALSQTGTIAVRAAPLAVSADMALDLYGNVRPGPHVEVRVTDSGTGLTAEAARHLFVDLFYTSKAKRLGLGLAVAYGVLHSNRGGLCLEPAPGCGTTARFVLPVATAVPANADDRASDRSRQEGVLVVDDDPLVLQLVSSTLERAGYRVEAVATSEAALASYTASPERFGLVLSDVIMPSLTGVDLARRVLSRDARARFLFMTGHAPALVDQPDLAPHHFGVLTKPFRPEGLLRAVRTALDRETSPVA